MTDLTQAENSGLPPVDRGSADWTRRVARGLAVNLAGNTLTLVIQLVSVPVLLGAWGVPTYGGWLILSAVPLYLALSDLSFATVAGNSMTMLAAAGVRHQAAALGRRVWSLVTLMTGATLVGAIFVALAFGGILGSAAAISVSESRVVLAALFAQVAVGNQFAMLEAWYKAGGHYPLGVTLRQFARLLEFGALIGAVLLGGRPGAAAAAFLGGSVVGLVVSSLVLRRAVPWVSFRPVKPDLMTFRGLLAPGVAFLAFPLGTTMSVQGLTLAIGLTLGAPAVVVFNTTRTMTRLIPQALHSINLSVGPELSRAFGAGQVSVARTIQRRAVQLSLTLSLIVVLALGAAGQGIVQAWTGGVVVAPFDLLVILLIVVLASSTWFTLASVLVATNRHKSMALIYLVSTSVAVVLAVPLSTAFGLVGAAFALLGIEIVMTLYAIPAALRAVDDTPGEFVQALLDARGGFLSLRHGTAGLSRRSLEGPATGGDES